MKYQHLNSAKVQYQNGWPTINLWSVRPQKLQKNRRFFSTEGVLNAILNSDNDSSDTDEEDSKAESSVDKEMSSDDCFFFGLIVTRS